MNRKRNSRVKSGRNDMLFTLLLIPVIFMICISDTQLTVILQFLLIVVLPGSCLLYWLDFRKQNRE